jgi:ABC-2 type transport system permease protein
VVLRTARRGEAMSVLAAAGAEVAATDRDTLTVTGLPAERIAALLGVYLGQVAAVLVGVLAATAEYNTGTMQVTLLADPRRSVVLAAKATVVAGAVLAAAVPAVLGSVLAGRLLLPANGYTAARGYPLLSLADGPTLRATAGTLLYLALVALLGLGAGMALREPATTLTLVLGVLFLVPMVGPFVTDPVWQARIQRLVPMTAGLSIQHTKHLADLPIGPWPGLGVLAGYAGVALAAGSTRFLARDA